MKQNAITIAVLSAIASSPSLASDAVDLGELEIIEQYNEYRKKIASDAIYESYDPIDSGLSVMGEASIQNNKPGGIDTTQLLKSNPFVQMDNSLDDATKENIQSLRPQNFSISGGNYYDNNIQIDGVSVTSVHSVTAKNTGKESLKAQGTYASDKDWNNVVGQTSQTVYVSPDLLDAVNVYDSNISAEFGDFIGGVVNYEIRKPRDKFGFGFSAGFQNDAMVKFNDPTEIDPDDPPEDPAEFYKYQTTVNFDLPLTDRLSVLASYSRSESSVKYQSDPEIGGDSYDNGDISQNFLLKGLYRLNDDWTFESQLIHSPYESERDLPSDRNDLTISESTGTQGYLSVSGYHKNTSINSKISVINNDSSRESANIRYKTKDDFSDWCGKKDCEDGGIGSLDQTQTDYTWNASFSTPVSLGAINYGSEIKYTEAQKARPEDVHFYTVPKASTNSGFICDPSDTACFSNYAYTDWIQYDAYNASVGVYSHALWSEYLAQLNAFEIRAGLRYSYDNFLSNHSISPRLTGSWEFLPSSYLTLGANRYHANQMVAYALREQMPAHSRYTRTVNDDGTLGDWKLFRTQPAFTNYRDSNLKTPYSDELTAAITIPTWLNGNARFKTVYRMNRDQFARSEELTNANGDEYYIMTNNGESDYLGLSLEWSGSYKKHFFNANLTWSETKSNGLVDYDEDPEDEAELVYFNGQIMTLADMWEYDARQNFAAPWRASASWSTMWFNDRLLTNATMYFRAATESLQDTGDNFIDADNKRYDIYDYEKVKALTTVDLNATYHLFRTDKHNASVDFRIKNIFNETTGSEHNYQIGRSFWLSVNYSM